MGDHRAHKAGNVRQAGSVAKSLGLHRLLLMTVCRP